MNIATQQRLLEALGLVPAEQSEAEPQDTGPPDFDGGVREPAPVPSDPEADHNALVSAFLMGGEW